ncbi:MAG TPA: aminoglycoside adenylyltransferase domain-containing protein [Gaiellales bacterium]|nr:aminoglycoside adenylyltransferase domain-containing protein [Gaiellales bacterium]
MTPAVEDYLAALVRAVRAHLSDGLAGAYLHGSAALGGWHPERSDLDVLVVSAGPVAPDVLRALAEAVSVRALPCPVRRGLELGVVTAASAAAPCARPRFELDVSTSAAAGDRLTLGGDRPGHADYLMHFAVCRAAGRALAGPPPAEVFGEAPAELLDAAFADELAWAADNAPPAYRVLNACRAWCFAAERRLVSKAGGGEWALGRGVSDDAIRTALAEQGGGPELPIAAAAIAALTARATAELGGASRYPAG